MKRFGPVVLACAIFSFSFLNCSTFRKAPLSSADRQIAFNATGLERSPDPLARGYRISANKQGIGDAYRDLPEDVMTKRYGRLREVEAGVKIYNIWWSELEGAGVRGSPDPVKCPAGFTMFPVDAVEKARKGFKHYHCYQDSTVASLDRVMRLDARHGIQSATVLWSSPEMYRIPGCKGFEFAGNVLMDGCVPRDDAMDDFEDYIRFLGSRYNDPQNGKLYHFVIWNENNAAGWFEYSPVVDTHRPRIDDPAQISVWIDKYADMIKRANYALRGNTSGVMIYASTDNRWAGTTPSDHAYFGSRTLIEGLWARLGTDFTWSIAVHPYGDASGTAADGEYGFGNLGSLVVDFQKANLAGRGIADWSAYPQSYLIASEQGWGRRAGDPNAMTFQARQVCHAHERAMRLPTLTGVTHNYFQSIEPAESDPNGRSGQGAFLGLLPYGSKLDLSDMESYPTGQAYLSTRASLWKQSNAHYCCAAHQQGCADGDVIGNIDEIVQDQGSYLIRGWACAQNHEGGIPVHLYAGGPAGIGTVLNGVQANEPAEPALSEVCRTTGSAHRFTYRITEEERGRLGGKLLYAYGISPYGRDNRMLGKSGEFGIPARRAGSPTASCEIPVSEQEYLNRYSDVRGSGLNPWLHYFRNGRAEGRCPIAGVCSIPVGEAEYLELYDDVRRSGIPPRVHYFNSGGREGRCPVR